MTDIQMLTWAIAGGFAGTWMLIFYVLNRIGKLDDKVTDVDRRVCHIEGAIWNKECCMLKHDHKSKAE